MVRARTADVLTASRIGLAFAVMYSLATNTLDWAAGYIAIAWLTDFYDGRLARSTSYPTRLGNWDFRIDAILAGAILVGMALGGHSPSWLVLLALLLGAMTVALSNPAPAMLFIAYAYAWFFWLLISQWPFAAWLPFAVLAFIAVTDWQRFVKVILPAFFKGLGALARGERSTIAPVLDRWANE